MMFLIYLFAFGLPVIAYIAVEIWRDLHATGIGHCKNCDYNLTGNTTGRCPECGTPIVNEN